MRVVEAAWCLLITDLTLENPNASEASNITAPAKARIGFLDRTCVIRVTVNGRRSVYINESTKRKLSLDRVKKARSSELISINLHLCE